MARGSGGITGGIRNLIGTVFTALFLVFAVGGWWLYNGGSDGGVQGCLDDVTELLAWLANLGKNAFGELKKN